MNRKPVLSFVLGMITAFMLSGLLVYKLANEYEEHYSSVYMTGYASEIFILDKVLSSNPEEQKIMMKSKLCENITILEDLLVNPKSGFDRVPFGMVVSKTLPEYLDWLTRLKQKYCEELI